MIAIVADGTAGLTLGEAKLYGVHIVPSSYSVNGRLYKDKYIDQPPSCGEEAVYSPFSECATYQPSPADFHRVFSELAKRGFEILCITISSKMSSAYHSASLAAEYLPKAGIKLVDSLSAGGGQYMLIKKARQLILSGKSLAETEAALNEIKKRIRIKFTVDDWSALAKSKRLGFVRRSAAPVLNYKPLFYCREGSVYSDPSARPARSGYDRIRALIGEIPRDARHTIINYVAPNELFRSTIKYLRITRPSLMIESRKISPAIGINIGRDMLAAVWYE